MPQKPSQTTEDTTNPAPSPTPNDTTRDDDRRPYPSSDYTVDEIYDTDIPDHALGY